MNSSSTTFYATTVNAASGTTIISTAVCATTTATIITAPATATVGGIVGATSLHMLAILVWETETACSDIIFHYFKCTIRRSSAFCSLSSMANGFAKERGWSCPDDQYLGVWMHKSESRIAPSSVGPSFARAHLTDTPCSVYCPVVLSRLRSIKIIILWIFYIRIFRLVEQCA